MRTSLMALLMSRQTPMVSHRATRSQDSGSRTQSIIPTGPSTASITSRSLISAAGCASRYPPLFPQWRRQLRQVQSGESLAPRYVFQRYGTFSAVLGDVGHHADGVSDSGIDLHIDRGLTQPSRSSRSLFNSLFYFEVKIQVGAKSWTPAGPGDE